MSMTTTSEVAALVLQIGALVFAAAVCLAMCSGNVALRYARRAHPALGGDSVRTVVVGTLPALVWLAARALASSLLGARLLVHETTRALAFDIAVGVWARWVVGFGAWFALRLWRLDYLAGAVAPTAADDIAPPPRRRRVLIGVLLGVGMCGAALLVSAVRLYPLALRVDGGTAQPSAAVGALLRVLELGVLPAYTLVLVLVGTHTVWRLTRALPPGPQFDEHRALVYTHAAVSLLVVAGQACDFGAAAAPGWRAWLAPVAVCADASAVAAAYVGTLARPAWAALRGDAEYTRTFLHYFEVFSPSRRTFEAAMRDPLAYEDFVGFLEGGTCTSVRLPVVAASGASLFSLDGGRRGGPPPLVLEVRPRALARVLRLHRIYCGGSLASVEDSLAVCRRLLAFAHGMGVPPPLPGAVAVEPAGVDPTRLAPIFVALLAAPSRDYLTKRQPLSPTVFTLLHAQLLATARTLFFPQYCARGRALLRADVCAPRRRQPAWTQLSTVDTTTLDTDGASERAPTAVAAAGTGLSLDDLVRDSDALAPTAPSADDLPLERLHVPAACADVDGGVGGDADTLL